MRTGTISSRFSHDDDDDDDNVDGYRISRQRKRGWAAERALVNERNRRVNEHFTKHFGNVN